MTDDDRGQWAKSIDHVRVQIYDTMIGELDTVHWFILAWMDD